jgi:hypothetical protein
MKMKKQYIIFGILFLIIMGSSIGQRLSDRQSAEQRISQFRSNEIIKTNLDIWAAGKYVDIDDNHFINVCFRQDYIFLNEEDFYESCRTFKDELTRKEILDRLNIWIDSELNLIKLNHVEVYPNDRGGL